MRSRARLLDSFQAASRHSSLEHGLRATPVLLGFCLLLFRFTVSIRGQEISHFPIKQAVIWNHHSRFTGTVLSSFWPSTRNSRRCQIPPCAKRSVTAFAGRAEFGFRCRSNSIMLQHGRLAIVRGLVTLQEWNTPFSHAVDGRSTG